MNIDQGRLEALMGRMMGELGALASAPLVLVGDRLGLYKAMAGSGPLTADELSERTGIRRRYALEWLNTQAAGGFVLYNAPDATYTLTPEAALVFADDDNPANLCGAYECVEAMFHDVEKVARAYRSGSGLGWHEHHPSLFKGTERFFRAGFNMRLVPEWIPALDGMLERLEEGASVADVGCGYGTSTIVMAKAFPKSRFVGYDSHAASIEVARGAAARAGVADRARFEVATAKDYPGQFDLVACFDCLHDMGDPVGVGRYVRATLKPDGLWMIVEPFAHDRTEDNLNPVGRIFYAASSAVCTPCSLSQEVGLALGAQAGESRLRAVVTEAGFARLRRAAETPFNLVLEARP